MLVAWPVVPTLKRARLAAKILSVELRVYTVIAQESILTSLLV